MNLIKSSSILKLLDKLDIKENSAVLKTADTSFVLNKLNDFFEFVQNSSSELVRTSNIIKNIDYFILLMLSLAIIAIPVASTGIIGLIILLSSMLLLTKYCFVKGKRISFSGLDLPVFLYMAIAGLSVVFSSLFFPSLKGYIKMLIYFGGYLTFLDVFKNNPKRIIYILGLLTLVALSEAFYAVYQQIVGVEPLAAWQDMTNVNPEQLMNRVYGSLKPFNPNLLAGYLIASFSSALGMAFLFLNRKNIRLSIIAFVGSAAILLAIIFTGSRGAYIASAFMSLIFIPVSGHIIFHDFNHIKQLKKIWLGSIIFGLLAIIAVIFLSPALQHRILSIFILRGDSSNSFRLNVYSACLKIIKDNWLIGIGTGNTTFRLIYGLYMITGFDALGAYNVLLEVTVESGIFALIAFLWLLLLSFIKGIKYIYKNNSVENKIIVSSCLIGITGLMAHGLVDTVWYRPQINLIFWMLIAVLCSITASLRLVYSNKQK